MPNIHTQELFSYLQLNDFDETIFESGGQGWLNFHPENINAIWGSDPGQYRIAVNQLNLPEEKSVAEQTNDDDAHEDLNQEGDYISLHGGGSDTVHLIPDDNGEVLATIDGFNINDDKLVVYTDEGDDTDLVWTVDTQGLTLTWDDGKVLVKGLDSIPADDEWFELKDTEDMPTYKGTSEEDDPQQSSSNDDEQQDSGDTLYGEDGADTFVIQDQNDHDVIHDFDTSEDMLQLVAFGFDSYEDVIEEASQVGGDVVLMLDDLQSVTLLATSLGDLSSDNFLLT